MLNILLAGASGNIGSFLLNTLNKEYSLISLSHREQSKNTKMLPLDLTQKTDIVNFIKSFDQFDILIFLVGLAHKKGKNKELSEFRNVNTQSLKNLLSVMRDEKKIPHKIIFASTISVYGEKLDLQIYNENSDKSPASPYAITKLEAEHFLLKNFCKKLWILRFAPIYSSTFLLNIHRRIKFANYFYRVGNGDSRISLCNLDNIKVVIENIIKGNIPSDIYNVSDTNYYSYNDLLEKFKVKNMVNIPKFIVVWIYYLSNIINNNFLKENSIKLISDNIYPSHKLGKYVTLPKSLDSIQND